MCICIYIYIYQCPYSYTTVKNHNRKSPAKKSSQITAKEGGGEGKRDSSGEVHPELLIHKCHTGWRIQIQ